MAQIADWASMGALPCNWSALHTWGTNPKYTPDVLATLFQTSSADAQEQQAACLQAVARLQAFAVAAAAEQTAHGSQAGDEQPHSSVHEAAA